MGIFNYHCKLGKKNCEILADETGQDCTDGVIYAVDSKCTKKFPVSYSGYGYCQFIDSKLDSDFIYDLGQEDFFECWDVKPSDKKAFFVCPTCANKIKNKVDKFEELEKKKKKVEKEKTLEYYTRQLEDLITQRDNINKEIRLARYQIKKLNKT